MGLWKKFIAVVAAGTMTAAMAACSGGAGAGTSGGGGGEQKVWKLAFNQTETHPQFIAMKKFGEELKKETDGRYSIDVFANEQLGTQKDVAEMVQSGTVEMMLIGGPLMENYNPDFVVFNLPYVFDTKEQQAKVLADENVTGELYKSLEAKNNISVVGGLHAGVRNVYNAKKPIRTPADMAGLKIRVQQSDAQIKMIAGMGGVGTPMGQGEVYTALQSGVLDGAENNETVYAQLKHDEVAKYYSYTKHLMIPDYLLINTQQLQGMSPEDRATFDKLSKKAIEEANTGFDGYISESLTAAKAANAQINDDVDIDAFKAGTQELVDGQVNANPTRKKLYDSVKSAG